MEKVLNLLLLGVLIFALYWLQNKISTDPNKHKHKNILLLKEDRDIIQSEESISMDDLIKQEEMMNLSNDCDSLFSSDSLFQ